MDLCRVILFNFKEYAILSWSCSSVGCCDLLTFILCAQRGTSDRDDRWLHSHEVDASLRSTFAPLSAVVTHICLLTLRTLRAVSRRTHFGYQLVQSAYDFITGWRCSKSCQPSHMLPVDSATFANLLLPVTLPRFLSWQVIASLCSSRIPGGISNLDIYAA